MVFGVRFSIQGATFTVGECLRSRAPPHESIGLRGSLGTGNSELSRGVKISFWISQWSSTYRLADLHLSDPHRTQANVGSKWHSEIAVRPL